MPPIAHVSNFMDSSSNSDLLAFKQQKQFKSSIVSNADDKRSFAHPTDEEIQLEVMSESEPPTSEIDKHSVAQSVNTSKQSVNASEKSRRK